MDVVVVVVVVAVVAGAVAAAAVVVEVVEEGVEVRVHQQFFGRLLQNLFEILAAEGPIPGPVKKQGMMAKVGRRRRRRRRRRRHCCSADWNH